MSLYPDLPAPADKTLGLGRIHVCFGPGVGKTSRAVGLAVRAAGAGLKAHFVQFMKSGDSSEVKILQNLSGVNYHCPGPVPFIHGPDPQPVHFEHAEKAWRFAQEAASTADVLICDEILNAVFFGLIARDRVLELMASCRNRVELMLTGSDAPPEIVEASDYATEFIQRKHPYYQGVGARLGIEY
ncbi:MAG: cob(I)yrinic acid a,c-diamide adenosyltransferase [Thermodesulfobacteriota bacterium]